MTDAPSSAAPAAPPVDPVRKALRPVTRPLKRALWRARVERDARRARLEPADLAVFHDFAPPPAGGANQSLRAVVAAMRRRGVRVELQTISPATRACLFNSFNFDFARLELLAGRATDMRMVHRVGAVTSLYRGFDDGTDGRVAEINRRLADSTLAISQATVAMYRQIGVELVDPHVVYNGCDEAIFNREGKVPFSRDRPTRVIATSWSDNPRKGAPTFAWLAQQLDPSAWQLSFVGNSPVEFPPHVRLLPPLASRELADELRAHDVFFTATENDAYSNALVEALSCGLPAIYLDSGGSGEAVKQAGFAFRDRREIPMLLDRLVDEYEERRKLIALPSLDEVVDGYLAVLGLDEFVGSGGDAA